MFKSRLAWRFFAMFVACALIPILALALVSYIRVTGQLEGQALERLSQTAKSHALWIYERLILADHQIQVMRELPQKQLQSLPLYISERNSEMFSALALLDGNRVTWASGEVSRSVREEGIRSMELSNRDVALLTYKDDDQSAGLALIRRVEKCGKGNCLLVGIVKPAFLWGDEQGNVLPPGIDFVVWDEHGNALFNSLDEPVARHQDLPGQHHDGMSRGQIQLTIGNQGYHAFVWSVFMKPRFHVPFWTVMVLEPKNRIFAPMHSFKIIFFCVVVLSLIVTVWLSSRAIEKSLIPIDKLMTGARHVSNQDFSHRVAVQSKDEFRDLADAFNSMASGLDRQFRTLVARADMDIAILSVLDLEKIILTSLNQINSFFAHKTAAISTFVSDDLTPGRSFIRGTGQRNDTPVMRPCELGSDEHRIFDEDLPWQEFRQDQEVPGYLSVLHRAEVCRYTVFPIRVNGRLFALVSFGLGIEDNHSQQELEQMRGFCNHLAVAFSNAYLIREMRELNMGTLLALARTVDAKSPWTGGHSVRVAQMAADIGTVMGLSTDLVEDLKRASLLHDIGKIGVPAVLLNKKGRLTPEEYEIIKSHPVLGARILTPIKVYYHIIPIVEQHHERYDGAGYPHGLTGENIDRSARIVAVADAFDAMVSDRPYRLGLSEGQAIDTIVQESGRQFDPSVVTAFRKAVSHRKASLSRSAPPLVFPEAESIPLSSLYNPDSASEVIPVKH